MSTGDTYRYLPEVSGWLQWAFVPAMTIMYSADGLAERLHVSRLSKTFVWSYYRVIRHRVRVQSGAVDGALKPPCRSKTAGSILVGNQLSVSHALTVPVLAETKILPRRCWRTRQTDKYFVFGSSMHISMLERHA